jgi:hypothetical protein
MFILEMLGKLNCWVTKVSIFLITVALIVGMVGCGPIPSIKTIEIRDWYDLDAIRNTLPPSYVTIYVLMNDLDSTTAGYEELASPTANDGKGWQPIGTWGDSAGDHFSGIFDGQGYEIRDLFINRPDEDNVGLFGATGWGGPNYITMVNFTVTGGDYVGVLVGGNDGQVYNCYCTAGSVTGNSSVGGLVGRNEKGIVSNSYFTGNVTGNSSVGGLVGRNEKGTVSYSYFTGNVTGYHDVGGLMGYNEVGSVGDSYSTGNVTGIEYVSGLVGVNIGTMDNCYSTGSVTGNSSVGGLVGKKEGQDTVSNSFWDIETSGQSTSAGGTGKTTAEMQDIATFLGAAWDIYAVNPGETTDAYTWNIINGVTYPFLSWQP